MATPWKKYETLILLSPELGTEGVEELLGRFRTTISDGGRMIKTERWGLRDMAFEIKHNAKCYYVLLIYAGESTVTPALHRQLNLLDSIVKFQTIKLEDAVDPEALPTEEEIVGENEPAPVEEEEAPAKEEAASDDDDEDEDDGSDDEDEDEDEDGEDD